MQIGKKIALTFILLLLFLPLAQNILNLFVIPPLNGDFVLPEKPQLQKTGWLSGDFQENYESYLEQQLGLHNVLVRLFNQIDYTLFRIPHAEGVVIGKKSVLFEHDYLRAWTGEDFIGERTWDKKLGKLKFLQDYLRENYSTDLVLVLEPSKARFEPEYIPDPYVEQKKEPANYNYIVSKANNLNIRFLDLNALYMKMKDTSRYLLYPKYGVHWSIYGMILMADTLIRYLENLSGIDMPDMYIQRIVLSDSLRDTDYDAAKPMNLLCELPHGPMAYPELIFEQNPAKTKPSVLVVGDSYYWNIFNVYIPQNLFSNEAFWYFNALVYPDTYYDTTWVSDLDIRAEVEKQDIVLLMVTERFLFKYDWGFIDALYTLYAPDIEPDLHNAYENGVRMNIGLFNTLVERAGKQGKSLEEIVHQEADFLFSRDSLTGYLNQYGPFYYERIIANDSNWMKTVINQSTEQHLTVEQALKRNADYMFWKEFPELHKRWHSTQEIRNRIANDSTLLASARIRFAPYFLPDSEIINQEACRQYRETVRDQERQARLAQIEQSIRNDPEWLKTVEEKAKQQNRTLDEMIRLDALWILQQKKE